MRACVGGVCIESRNNKTVRKVSFDLVQKKRLANTLFYLIIERDSFLAVLFFYSRINTLRTVELKMEKKRLNGKDRIGIRRIISLGVANV